MESILLGGLALAGFNTSKPEEKKIQKKKNLDDSYGSNISDKINKIEKNQANNLKNSIQQNRPEFLKQFDELTFDNMADPVPITDSHMTITGINNSLQRGLDLNNGYSNLQDSLNYGVVSKEHFTHNNMTPNTSKRDYTLNSEHSSRKLEAFTGVSDYWVAKKEKKHLFEPMKDLTYVNGMPVMTDYLDDRYLASNKNNMGNLPFQNNVKVRPGLDGDVRQGLGTVYRINPRTVDELRGEHNQKVTYENKPLETIKKGEYRAPDYNLTKFKLPDFREVGFEDLVQGRSQMEGSRKTGKYTDINTQRGDNDVNYSGHAYIPTMGEGPSKNKTKFEPSKRQENYNDPTHAVVAVNVKPVMQNKGSYVNRETQRASMKATEVGPAFDNNGASYVLDPNYVPLTTMRELMIHGNTNLGVAGSQQKANYVFSNDMVLPTTTRETTSHDIVLGAKGENNTGISQPTDQARKTTKETTLGYRGGFANPTEKTGASQFTDSAKITTKETTLSYRGGFANPTEKTGASQFTDSAKTTTKETTLSYKGGFANPTEKTGASYFTDSAKITIKQTTLHTTPGVNVASLVSAGYAKDYDDIAKTTIKQTTLHNTPGMNVTGVEAQMGYTRDEKDTAKITVKQTTLYTTPGMNVTGVEAQMGYTRDEKDTARTTIKQTTENNNYQGHIRGTDNHTGYTRDVNDKARTTIKETTHLQDYTGGLHGEVDGQTSHMATDNICIDERREITTFNRTSGGGANLAGPQINKNNVKMNNKKTSVYYVTNAGKAFDQSVMPSRAQPYQNNTFENKKSQLTYGDYRTNNVFINTLKDNPLVNDIYHQKNV